MRTRSTREAPRSRVREARCRDGIRRRATALESRHAVRRARPHAGGPIGPMTCSARPGRYGVRPYMTAVPLPSPLASISPLPAVTTVRSALAPGLDDVTNHEANFKGSRGKLFIVPERYNAISLVQPSTYGTLKRFRIWRCDESPPWPRGARLAGEHGH